MAKYIIFILSFLFWTMPAKAQSCRGWEVSLSNQNDKTPSRTVSVNNRDPRVFCSQKAIDKGDCVIAPQGNFHVLALVGCPPPADAAEFDNAMANPNKTYDLELINICTAVRIKRTWALTAAHCITEKDGKTSFIDDIALALDFESNGVRRLAVLPIHSIHQSGDDLALLKFDPKVAPEYDSVPPLEVSLAEIYDSSALLDFDESKWSPKVWGYGESNIAADASSGLLGRLVEARIKTDNSSLPEAQKKRLLRANSADPDSPKLCSSDSGGPWFIEDTMLIGISIKSSATCNSDSSNIADAIRVAPFCRWIEKTTCNGNNAVCCVRGEQLETRTTEQECACGN